MHEWRFREQGVAPSVEVYETSLDTGPSRHNYGFTYKHYSTKLVEIKVKNLKNLLCHPHASC
jgi:hypothetical protein